MGGGGTSLDELVECFLSKEHPDSMPLQLKTPGVNRRAVNALVALDGIVTSGNMSTWALGTPPLWEQVHARIYELYLIPSPQTEGAYLDAQKALIDKERSERYGRRKEHLRRQIEASRRTSNDLWSRISRQQKTIVHDYLVGQGLPPGKADKWSRRVLFHADRLIALASGRTLYQGLRPTGEGLYSAIGYPLRRLVRKHLFEGSSMPSPDQIYKK